MPDIDNSRVPPERLKEVLSYNADTGEVTWRHRRGKMRAGDLAGCISSTTGYRVIRVDDNLLAAHRIAWAMHYGRWPTEDLDQKNGVRSDNRIGNLREATDCQNLQNTSIAATNTSGYKGVSWCKRTRKWGARIGYNGVYKVIGKFTSKEDAHAAYQKKSLELHGEFSYQRSRTES